MALEACMSRFRQLFWTLAAIAGLAPTALAAQAVDRCLAVASRSARIVPAVLQREVRLTFLGHATWLIESPHGVRIATDYNDFVHPPVVPDIVTMNRAHITHYSLAPDKAIRHVLPGWNPSGGPARHDLLYGDVRVRNVATNIRDFGGGGTIPYGNSIFIFEIAGLCIGHLGHLHHTLTEEQLTQIGQLDVVMVPVDGSYTMDTAGMVEVIKALRARLILPMHYFNPYTLNRFLDHVRADFKVEMAESPSLLVSTASLPGEPTVLVVPGS
jgi:L-ascorbate metabolism protein UlaG (beta-lactamase superfamily)